LQALFTRWPGLKLDTAIDQQTPHQLRWNTGVIFRGLEALPVTS
jgi:hypothetical protein